MKIYGTTTSPFVRRLRVVAAEVGEPIERVDTATDAGMALLREVSPIRKVPVAMIDDRPLFDSHAIVAWLTERRGWGGLAPPGEALWESNVLNAIDGALDSVIQLFYLRRDGVAIDGTPYADRQLERADAIFAWLATQLRPREPQGLGFVEVALICALDWMDFRNTFETGDRFARLRTVLGARPSLEKTKPHD